MLQCRCMPMEHGEMIGVDFLNFLTVVGVGVGCNNTVTIPLIIT